jgi:cell division protein FtsZ
MNVTVNEQKNEQRIEQRNEQRLPAIIKVLGTGGAGGNALDRMIECGLEGVEFIAVNTDIQDLAKNRAAAKLQIGSRLTGGRGAGGIPEIGEKAALEDIDLIAGIVERTDMVFITAGMGGGTGTGAAPVIAKVAKDAGALTVGVVTKPFDYEARAKMSIALEGIRKLREVVDTLIIIPNQYLFKIVDQSTPLPQAYLMADEVLRQGVQGISDLINKTGFQNLDFADVESTLKGQGIALMGIGYGRGENRAREAVVNAVENPLLEDITIEGATRVLINITCSPNISLVETQEIVGYVTGKADRDVQEKHGIIFENDLEDQVKVTVIATGFQNTGPRSRQGGVEGVRPVEPDILGIGEWEKIQDRSRQGSGLTHRNGRDDLDYPTVLRGRGQGGLHNDSDRDLQPELILKSDPVETLR